MSARSTSRLEDYQVLGIIGTGTFGTCYKVENKITGQICVWKAVKYGAMKEDQKKLLVSEVNLLSQLRHPNIVRYYDRIIDKASTTLYIVMEYCEGGDLSTVIKRCKSCGGLVMEAFVWHVLYQTARALQGCHWHVSATILHRDIKPANVFLDCCYNIKLGDFGLARVLEHKYGMAHTLVGTPSYMSPEVMKGSKYNKMSDIWALGCLIYELCSLAPPFKGNNMRELAQKIIVGRFERIPSYYSENLQNIITFLLSVDQEKRPAVEDILQHPTVVSQVAANKFAALDLKSATRGGTCDTQFVVTHEPLVTVVERPLAGRDDVPVCQDTWLNRMESLKQRESVLRTKEVALIEREREVEKREKKVAMLDRLAKEKVARADVYLHQCREARSLASSIRGPQQRASFMEEDLDSSFSADPGDTSMGNMTKPPPFTRSASERRVHFTLPATRAKKWDSNAVHAEMENMQNRILSTMNVNLPIKESGQLNCIDSLQPAAKSEAYPLWPDKKKHIFHSTQDETLKENIVTCMVQRGNSHRMQPFISKAFTTSAQSKATSVLNLRW